MLEIPCLLNICHFSLKKKIHFSPVTRPKYQLFCTLSSSGPETECLSQHSVIDFGLGLALVQLPILQEMTAVSKLFASHLPTSIYP